MKNNWKLISALVLIGALIVYLFFTYWSAFSAFGVAILLVTCGSAVLLLADKYLLKELDTVEQVKEGNLAYVALLWIIAYMLVELTKAGLG